MEEIIIKLSKDQAYELEKILDMQKGLLLKTFIQILDKLSDTNLSKEEKDFFINTNQSLLKLQYGVLHPIIEQLENSRRK